MDQELETSLRKDLKPLLATELVVASLFINILGLAVPLYVVQILNRYVNHGIDGTLISLASGAVLAVILEFSFRSIRTRLTGCASTTINRKLGMKTFAILVHMRGQILTNIPNKVRTEIMQGLETVQQASSAANITGLLDVPFALLYLLTLWMLSTGLFLISTIVILITLGLTYLTTHSTHALNNEMAKEMTNRRVLISSAASTGVDTIRAFDAQSYTLQCWQKVYNKLEQMTQVLQTRQGVMQSLTQAITAIMTIAIVGVGAKMAVAGEISVGVVMGANILAARALMPISRLAQFGPQFAKAHAAFKQLEQFHRLPIEMQRGSEIRDFKGDLELVDLSFAYQGSPGPLFESVSIKLPHGSIIAVIGQNGVGKTTFARLLMGLLDPMRGQILADGVDLRQVSPNWWRHHVSYMPQEPGFMEATLAENISIGLDEGLSEEKLQLLVDISGLRPYVSHSANGLDEMIYNNGRDLSLGIRRRIALARALATNGKVLIFDEPTEGLDLEGQQIVYTVLNHRLEMGCTVFVFSHDPGLLKNCHYVIDLNAKPVPRIGMNKQLIEAATRARTEAAARASEAKNGK